MREEIIGEENGRPPIMLRFTDETGKPIGFYVRHNLTERPYTSGPMFGGESYEHPEHPA